MFSAGMLRGSNWRRVLLTFTGFHDSFAFAPYVIPALITGESGTGKEKIAQLIHHASGGKGPLVTVNCADVREQFADSMLFGHVKGAFTGATETHVGKSEQADGGTLFLDKLGELSLNTQARLVCSQQLVPSDMRVSNRRSGPERTLHERQEAHSRTDHCEAA